MTNNIKEYYRYQVIVKVSFWQDSFLQKARTYTFVMFHEKSLKSYIVKNELLIQAIKQLLNDNLLTCDTAFNDITFRSEIKSIP